jgi:6-phosphogluconolactonase/glucosamine-6-phosphate isomerase/deaminase
VEREHIKAHLFRHLLHHGKASQEELHRSLSEEHNLRDEEQAMARTHMDALILTLTELGHVAMVEPRVVELTPSGREEALQYLEQHGRPPV